MFAETSFRGLWWRHFYSREVLAVHMYVSCHASNRPGQQTRKSSRWRWLWERVSRSFVFQKMSATSINLIIMAKKITQHAFISSFANNNLVDFMFLWPRFFSANLVGWRWLETGPPTTVMTIESCDSHLLWLANFHTSTELLLKAKMEALKMD